ncbi:hypothetical protein CBR_g45316 [Chara braunii]|uniref:Integrase zinc-binding domain-containing protein n=1 Tax=Chara braunii TaxID=69332 RepID=A0A388LY77_CHABU|nr:hypothetical protein CBR_g45316 [Chara braunii]|eukprot:GBG87256.1 hypothetical protein CBR_g45316 [Chara braunii]
MVDTRSGKSTSPCTQAQQEQMAALVKENRERKELQKQAKFKAIAEEQAAKMKKLEEEMEEKKRVVEEEVAAEEAEERRRREAKGESSGTASEDAEMEKKISEWIANLSLGEDEEAQLCVPQEEKEAFARALARIEEPLERQETEEEKKLERKLRMKREKKRRREEVNRLTTKVDKVRACRQEVQAQSDVSAKMDKMLGYLEVLSEVWLEERQANWGHDVALSAMRSGFQEFARDMVTHVGAEVRRLRDNLGKFCEGAIEGAKAVATVESEARPSKDPVKLKFPDAYGGKPEENFDNWEASVNSYVYLQHNGTAGCENNMVAYSKVTPLPQFFKHLRERFADLRRGVRASDKLQTIHSRQWRSVKALKAVMDDLVAVPDHGVTESQLVQLFYRAMPEPLRGHFFDKSQQSTLTYDALSREVVLFEAKSMPVSTFWHKDLDKGKKWKGRTISGQVRAKDHMILPLEEGDTDEVPYSQIEWGLEEEDSDVGQGRSYAAVAAGGRPQNRGGGQGQRGQAMGGRGLGRSGGWRPKGPPRGRLLKKEAIWQWDKDCTSALKKLKHALIEYPVLKVPDPSLPFVVTTDASQYGIGAVLQQDDDNGYRPVEFMSARMPSEKVATSKYERELYALRQALEHWKHYLLGRHFKVYSDHETLRWLKTQAKMTPKLTRWAAEIDQYDFELKPVKGKYNVVADALSRRSDYFGAIVHYLDIGSDLQEKVRQAYAFLKRVKEAPETELDYRNTEGLLFEKTNVVDHLCIPNSEEIRSLILGECHDTEGHFGWQKTLANLKHAYTWPGMKNDCIEYVRSCKVCERNKTTTRAPLGLLRPLPIPDQP